jgi:hypothetical protein
VLVQVSIAAIEDSLTIERKIEFQGLGPDLNAAISPTTVDVILTGPLSTLAALTPEDVHVVLNLLNLPPGLHQVTPEVIDLPDRVTAKTILPATVEVLITAGPGTPTGTPTPTATPTRAPTRAASRTPTPTETASATATP